MVKDGKVVGGWGKERLSFLDLRECPALVDGGVIPADFTGWGYGR